MLSPKILSFHFLHFINSWNHRDVVHHKCVPVPVMVPAVPIAHDHQNPPAYYIKTPFNVFLLNIHTYF
jgi:hypothetical protein